MSLELLLVGVALSNATTITQQIDHTQKDQEVISEMEVEEVVNLLTNESSTPPVTVLIDGETPQMPD